MWIHYYWDARAASTHVKWHISSCFIFQKILFSLGGSFLYYADRFKIYSAFCASHTKVPKVLVKGEKIAAKTHTCNWWELCLEWSEIVNLNLNLYFKRLYFVIFCIVTLCLKFEGIFLSSHFFYFFISVKQIKQSNWT